MYTFSKTKNEILVVRGEEIICHIIIDEYTSEEAAEIMADRIAFLLNEATSVWEISSSKVLNDAEKRKPESIKHEYIDTTGQDESIEKIVADAFDLAKQGKSVKIKRI